MFHVEHFYNSDSTILKWVFVCETVLISIKCVGVGFTFVMPRGWAILRKKGIRQWVEAHSSKVRDKGLRVTTTPPPEVSAASCPRSVGI